jgi:hypothetical protein
MRPKLEKASNVGVDSAAVNHEKHPSLANDIRSNSARVQRFVGRRKLMVTGPSDQCNLHPTRS